MTTTTTTTTTRKTKIWARDIFCVDFNSPGFTCRHKVGSGKGVGVRVLPFRSAKAMLAALVVVVEVAAMTRKTIRAFSPGTLAAAAEAAVVVAAEAVVAVAAWGSETFALFRVLLFLEILP
jgi:hypothetical protein